MENEVRALTTEEKQRLRELLLSPPQPLTSIEELAAQQGTRPLSFDEMLGDFWPEDETADEFIATLRQWRNETNRPQLDR